MPLLPREFVWNSPGQCRYLRTSIRDRMAEVCVTTSRFLTMPVAGRALPHQKRPFASDDHCKSVNPRWAIILSNKLDTGHPSKAIPSLFLKQKRCSPPPPPLSGRDVDDGASRHIRGFDTIQRRAVKWSSPAAGISLAGLAFSKKDTSPILRPQGTAGLQPDCSQLVVRPLG